MLSVRTTDHPSQITMRLAGQLVGMWVDEVDRLTAELLAEGRSLRLDLEELTFADGQGVELLRRLHDAGAVWWKASHFVLCLLEEG